VCVEKEIREEEGIGRGGVPQKRARAEQGDWCLCLFLSGFVSIKYVIYLSTNYEDFNF